VKEKVVAPALTVSNNDMDLLDDDKSSLIKDGSLPPTNVDINMVFMLPTEFIGVKEEVAQMCLSANEVMFEKLHGDDTPGFHRVAPHTVMCRVGLHELIILPSKLLEDGV
jgi:hypothetical protein